MCHLQSGILSCVNCFVQIIYVYRKKRGPRTEPCETPCLISVVSESKTCVPTSCDLLER